MRSRPGGRAARGVCGGMARTRPRPDRDHAPDPAPPAHRQRRPGRRRGHQPQADGARRPRAPACGRHLRVPARRLARHAEDRRHHPRRDGRHRLPGDADARPAPGRAVAGVGALERDRRRDVPPQGPQGRRHGAGDDPRGGHHLDRGARDPQSQAAPSALVPHPDQGTRRGASQERHPAYARVHHEGLVQPRPRHGRTPGELPEAHRRLRPHHGALRPRDDDGAERPGHDGRRDQPRVHGPERGRRGRGRLLPRLRLRGQRRAGGGRGRGRGGGGLRRFRPRARSRPRTCGRSSRSRRSSACRRAPS